jgi:dTDP-4-amino-4,6-dideoxygalactose transaminase
MPPLPLELYARRPARKLPYPLDEPACRIFGLARQGLFMGIQALGLEPGNVILVPAFNHGSEIEALVRAGIDCRFYEVGRRLEPDEEELEALLDTGVRALYLIHYLGLPQDAARWRAWCDERGLLLIEDAAQAWLSWHGGTPVGSHGDLAIFCLYKTFGLPEGAAVISRSPPDPPASVRQMGLDPLARRHFAYLAQRWRWAAELRRRFKGDANDSQEEFSPEREFGLGGPFGAYSTTRFFVNRVADPAAQKRRAANYDFLLERLRPLVPQQFAQPPAGASPFAFPIRSDRAEELIDRLARHSVVAGRLWPQPHPCLPHAEFPGAAVLRVETVVLPVHQELRARDLERIVDVVYSSVRLVEG